MLSEFIKIWLLSDWPSQKKNMMNPDGVNKKRKGVYEENEHDENEKSDQEEGFEYIQSPRRKIGEEDSKVLCDTYIHKKKDWNKFWIDTNVKDIMKRLNKTPQQIQAHIRNCQKKVVDKTSTGRGKKKRQKIIANIANIVVNGDSASEPEVNELPQRPLDEKEQGLHDLNKEITDTHAVSSIDVATSDQFKEFQANEKTAQQIRTERIMKRTEGKKDAVNQCRQDRAEREQASDFRQMVQVMSLQFMQQMLETQRAAKQATTGEPSMDSRLSTLETLVLENRNDTQAIQDKMIQQDLFFSAMQKQLSDIATLLQNKH